LLSLNTNDTPSQTKAIFKALASEKRDGIDKTEWHKLQEWLQAAEHRVVIPYAAQLAELIPPIAVRLRRDFGALLALIKTHAILHQATREKDADGRLIATIDDYALVRELVAPIMSEGAGATVSPVVRETVEAVEAKAGDSGAMALAIAEHLKLDKGTVSRRLSVAASQGYIHNLEERRGKPGRWVKGDPLPEKSDLLPQSSKLHAFSDAGCTVAVDSEGYIKPTPAGIDPSPPKGFEKPVEGEFTQSPGLTPGRFLAEATALFNATPVSENMPF
jgi:DNA-binding transcriptional ArsR family regulator